jgi:RNA polymerase sigma-70 factor (ECF subfamily)
MQDEAAAMGASSSFTDLMARLRAGDQAAARQVFQRFVHKLVRLARERMGQALRRRVDPEEVVQSAYKSFFLRYGAGKLDVQDWSSLWSLLTVITLRKCVDRVDYHHAQRRDVRREARANAEAASSEPWWEAVSREPTPVEAAVLAETLEQLLRDMEERERPMLEMSLQGYTSAEIGERLGVSERTVRRVRERVRKRLERMQLADQ